MPKNLKVRWFDNQLNRHEATLEGGSINMENVGSTLVFRDMDGDPYAILLAIPDHSLLSAMVDPEADQ
jgi:hypothetical protein